MSLPDPIVVLWYCGSVALVSYIIAGQAVTLSVSFPFVTNVVVILGIRTRAAFNYNPSEVLPIEADPDGSIIKQIGNLNLWDSEKYTDKKSMSQVI